MEKKSGWIKKRHKLVIRLLAPVFGVYVRWKYGITIEKFKEQGTRPYLIVMNHQTAYDQFFVALTFNRPVYYIASEDIFSMGWVSDLIRFLVAPIPIKKQTVDLQAVKNCIKVAREGGTICVFPEGNRTFNGKTLHMNPAIASLAKKLGLPVAIMRLEGGYGVQPRWSDVVRKGKMRSYVSRVVEPEEYRELSSDALFDLIEKALYVDEACASGEFHHKKSAEYLERAMYVCPWCGLSEFESRNDITRCKMCDRQVRYLPTKELEGVNCHFPHRFVDGWYQAQNDYINGLDLLSLTDVPVYTHEAQLSRVIPCKNKELLQKKTSISLYGDRITVGDMTMPFALVSAVVVLGKNKLNIYFGKELYQIQADKHFNALKFVNFYHRYKNMTTGEGYGKFLGL